MNQLKWKFEIILGIVFGKVEFHNMFLWEWLSLCSVILWKGPFRLSQQHFYIHIDHIFSNLCPSFGIINWIILFWVKFLNYFWHFNVNFFTIFFVPFSSAWTNFIFAWKTGTYICTSLGNQMYNFINSNFFHSIAVQIFFSGWQNQ